MQRGAMVVATYNLWGFGEPWRYTARRGIDRGAVPGSAAATLRLPNGVWPRRRALLAQALARVQPDVVGLQEVCCDPATGASQAEQLAADLGCTCAFQPVTITDYGEKPCRCGLAVLARHPIRDCRAVPLPSPENTQQYAIHAVVETSAGTIDLLVVHLTPRSEEAQLAAVEQLQAYLAALSPERRCLAVGDFNAVPDSPPIHTLVGRAAGRSKPLRDAWQEAHPDDPGPTMPSEAPAVRLDYLLVGPGLDVAQAVRLGEQPDPDGFYPSDHLGVAATFRWSAG